MAKPVERSRRASAGPSNSDQRPQFSQPPRPGTPFSGPRPGSPFKVPQWDDGILSQWGKRLPHRPGTPFRGQRPGTPFSVPQGADDSAPQWETYLTSTKFPRDFASPGVLRLARHKFRCQKPYKDKTAEIAYTGAADSLRSLRALTKTTSSKKTLDPLKEQKEIKEGQVLLSPEVPDCRSNPLSREPRPSVLPPATRKRVASTSVHRPRKVQRSLDMSTVFEEPMDFDHSRTRVSATSPRPCAGDASEKVNEDDRVPGPSSADSSTDRRGLVISPQFQGSLQPPSPTQGALGYSTSSQDAQGLPLSTGEILGGTQCDQGSMGQPISSQASQKPLPLAERKIKHVSFSRRVFKSPSSSREVTNHSDSLPKSFRQAPSDQGGLQQAPLDKEGSKCFSPKGVLSDCSFSQNGMCPTPSPQKSLTPLTADKDDWGVIPSHEESQACSPSPQNDPKESVSAEVSLSPASSDQGNFISSPLNQDGFKCPPPENGLGSSLTAQGGPNPITTPQVSLTPLMPTQAETKLSTSTSVIPEPLLSSEGALESSTYLQEMLGTPKSTQGTLVPSQHTQRSLAPASNSLGVLSPSISVKRTPELSTSREVGQRPILSHKRKFKPNPYMKMGKKRRTDPPSEQGEFPVSLSDQEGSKYTLPIKKALLIHHWKQNSQRYAKRVQVSHAHSTTTQSAKTIQPSLLPQESLGLSTCVGEALEISTYTQGLPGHLQPVQDVLGSTICDKGTVGQDTCAEGVPDSSPSLEMVPGCDTCTQEFVANFTSREGDSLDSTCPQTPTGPLHSSQEAVEVSPSPQGYQQSVTTTQEAIGRSPSAQRDVSISTCPQVTPEHSTNTPKVLNSTLSSQGPLESVLSIKLSLEPNIPIQKALLSSTPVESVPKTPTFTQGAPVTSLADHEDFRPTTYAQETLEDTTPTQVLETFPHSETVVKIHTCTPDTVAPSPSEQEPQGSTTSHEGTLPSSPSTQESFKHIPSQGGNSKHVPSTQVGPGCSISTKKRLRDEPSDEGDFRTSSSEEGSFILLHSSKRVCASSTAPKETSITTSTPQVSTTPPISVQKDLQCSTSEQKTVEPCHSNQGPREHSISSQEAQGPSLSFLKGLCHLPSVPGLQGHSPSLSKAQENSTCTQGDLSISKSDLGALKSSLSVKGSKRKAKCKQKHLEPFPLAQEDLTSPMSSKPSKDPSASSCLLAAEHFPSPSGSPIPSTSKQWYLGTSSSCQRFLENSPSAPGDLYCSQVAQGAKELLPSAQGPQEKIPPSLSYSGHLPNLPEDEEDSSPEQGILEHVPPAQGSLETSCSPGVPLQKPLLSLEKPLDLSIPMQGNAGTSQSAQGLQRFLPSTQEYLENSPSAFKPLEHLPVAPKARELSTLSQETPSPLLPVHGTIELPQYGSEAVPSMPSVQGLQGSLSPLEGSIAPVLSVHGSVGHSLSAQAPIEIYKSTKATPGHSLSSLDDMSPLKSSQGTLGLLSSVEVDVGTYSHNTGSPGQLKNISGFPGSKISDHDPVLISLPAQGTLRHLPSAKEDVGLSLSAQQAPELSTLEQGSIQHVEAAKVALVNPSSPKRATGKLQCAQYALEHLPPSEGALQHSSTHQGTQESLKSSLESLEILSSNSEHVKNSLSATGGLQSLLSGSRVLGYELADKHPEQHSIYKQGSQGNPLSTLEVQEHLVPLKGNLKSCQSAKEGQKTLIPSQIVLESVPSISEDLEALSSALEHMGLSSLANESLENSQYAGSVVESSSSATGTLRTTFVQKSLENSLPGKGIREILSSSQGALEILSSTKGRVENVSSPERSMKPPTSLQEPSRPSSLIQGPHQHPLPTQGPLGPVQTDSGIQGPLLTLEAGGNLSGELGSCKSFPLTPETLDHLQSAEGPDDLSISAHEMFDSVPSTQGTLGIFAYSSGLMEPSESEHRKLGHVSSVGKDGEISPFEKPAKSTSPLTPYIPVITEVLESSSCGLGALGSLLSAREDAKDTASAPHAQEPSLSTSQALEHSVTTQGPLQISTPDKQTLCSLTSRVEDVEHSTFSPEVRKESQMLPNILDHLSNRGESQEFSFSAPGIKNISLLAREPLEHSSLQNATQPTFQNPQEVVGSLLSVQGSLGQAPSDHGSLGPLASTLGAGGPSLSEADTILLSASAPVTKVPGSLKPSQSEKSTLGSLSSPAGTGISSPGSQEMFQLSASSEYPEPLLYFGLPLELSMCAQGTLCPFSSPQGELDPLHCFSGNLESSQPAQMNLSHLSSVREPVGNSPSVPGPREPSFDQGSPESSTSSHKVQDPSYNQGSVAQSPSVPGDTPSLSAQGILQNLSSSKVTLETSSSLQKDIEGLLDVHGAQQLQRHSPGYLGHSQYTPESSETLTSPQMVFKCSESSSLTLETLPPLPGTLGHSLSSQNAVFPSDSDQQIQESSSLQKSVQFSPSSKDSLRPIPSVLGTSQSLLSAQLCPKSSISAQGFLGSSPPQQGCSGDSLSMQRALGTSISAQEFVGHSKSDQESPEMFTSSQENLGPSLFQEALVHSSSIPQDCRLSQSSKDMLGTSLSTQDARKTPSSVQGSIVTVPSAQSVLEFQTSLERPLGTSQFASETTKPLPFPEEFYSTLKSLSRSIETLTSILETLTFSTFAKGAADPSKTDQVILRSPTVSDKPLEFSPSDQQSVKPASSKMGPDRTSLTDKGLQETSSGEKVPLGDSPLQQTCSGNALSTQGALGLSISAQEALGYPPSAHGSPDTSISSEEASGTCLDQGHSEQPLSLLLSKLGDLRLSEYSQWPLETSPSTHSTLEIPSSTHGIIETSPPAQDSLRHLPPSAQILQQAPLMPETSEPLSSTKEACNISDSSPGTSETFPSIPGSLEISFSAQSTMGPSVSEKEIIGSSVSLEESLGPSPPEQGSLRSTPPASGTGSLSPSEQGCQKISSCVQGHSPSQQCYTGNSLHSQEALCLSISAQESLEYSPSAQGSPDTSLSSEKALGPSLDFVSLGHSPSDPRMLGLSNSDDGTLETPPFTQSILEIQSSNNGVTDTSTTSQDSLEYLPPSVQNLQPSLIPETSEPLSTAKEVCKTSESVLGALESLPSLLEALRHLNSDQCTLGPSVYDQGNLEPSTPLHDTLGNPKPSQSVLEPIPSIQKGVGTFFSTEILGLSTCAHDDFIPIHSHGDCLRYSSYPNKSHRRSNSTKKIASHAPFPEGDIRYSLSELDALRSSPSAKSRLTSSIYVRKDSNSTSTPPRSVSPPASSELTFRSSSPPKEDLRCSPSPRGGSRHSKSKKTKLKHAPKESCLKSVPSEDEGLKCYHSPTRVGRDLVSNKVGARFKTEPKESLTTTSAKGGCRSSQSHEEGHRCSPSPQGNPRCSKSTKIKLEQVPSNKADVHVSHSEHEGCKLRSLSKIESKHSSSKRDQKPKATHQECIEPSISKGAFRSSRSHEKGGRSSASPQASHKYSRSIKTKLEQVPSNKADVHASHTEHEDCKHLSLSQRGFSHASSAKRDKKPDTTPQQSIEASTSTEEDIGTTPPHEETLRHSTSPHGTSSLTSTSTRTRLRHFPYTQEVIKTSTEAQESFRSSPDGDSPRGSVKFSSLSQNNDVRHPVSTKEDFKHTLSIQEGHKPSTGAREGSGTWIPVRWGLLYPPIPKGSGTSFPVVQGNFRHIRPQLADLRSSLSYQGRDTAFQYEHGTPICNPSVLGGHRYSHSVSCSLRRIPLQKRSLSSYLSTPEDIRPSQCDQRGLRLSYGHPVQGSFRIFQSERERLKNSPSKSLSLTFAPCDQREFRNVPSNVEWVRTSTSAPGSLQRNPSAHGGFKPYKPVKPKF